MRPDHSLCVSKARDAPLMTRLLAGPLSLRRNFVKNLSLLGERVKGDGLPFLATMNKLPRSRGRAEIAQALPVK
jgi:hypothetical protein